MCLVDYSEGVIEGFEIQGPDPANNVMHGLLRTVTDPNHIMERVKIRDFCIHDVGSYCIGQQFGGLRDVIVENNVIEDTGADGIDWQVRTGKPANIENNCWGVKILGNTIWRPANRLSSDVSGIGLRGQAILEGNHVYELPAGCYGIELVPGIGTVADWRQSANRTICSDWYVEAADPTSDTVGLLAWASGGITIGPGYAKGCRVQSLAPSMTPYDFRNGRSFTGVIVDGVRGRDAFYSNHPRTQFIGCRSLSENQYFEAKRQNLVAGQTSLPIKFGTGNLASGMAVTVFKNGTRLTLATDYTVTSTTIELVASAIATDAFIVVLPSSRAFRREADYCVFDGGGCDEFHSNGVSDLAASNTTTGLIDGFLWERKPSVSQRLDVGATAGLTATGPNADQDLRLSPQGSGLVRIDNPSYETCARKFIDG